MREIAVVLGWHVYKQADPVEVWQLIVCLVHNVADRTDEGRDMRNAPICHHVVVIIITNVVASNETRDNSVIRDSPTLLLSPVLA